MTASRREHWLIWSGVLEIFTVGGIFYGWPAYVFVLKEEGIFYELCNDTETTTLPPSVFNATLVHDDDNIVKHCAAQDTYYNMLFIIGCSMSNVCGMLFGYFLDKFGLLSCRLLSAFPLTIGLTLMIFYDNHNCLVVGLEMLAFSAIGTLLSNLTLQSIWPTRMSSIGSMFSGTFDGSAATFMFVKVLYDSFGIPLRTITICLACLSIIHWLRTFFLVPTTRIPSVLPEEGYDLASHSLALKLCGTKTDQSENLPMNEELKKSNRDEDENFKEDFEDKAALVAEEEGPGILKQMMKHVCSVQFAALAFWYCLVSLRINAYQSWFNPSLQWMFPGEKHVQSELTNIFGLTYIMSLPLSPVAGATVDFFARTYKEKENDEYKGRVYGIAFVCAICSVFSSILSFLCSFQHNYAIAVTGQIIFSTIRTFLYAILAQAAFLLFPHHLFGLIYGFLNLLNGLTTLMADPIFRYIQNNLDGDYTIVHYILSVTSLLTVVQSFILVRHKSH